MQGPSGLYNKDYVYEAKPIKKMELYHCFSLLTWCYFWRWPSVTLKPEAFQNAKLESDWPTKAIFVLESQKLPVLFQFDLDPG